VTPTTELTPEPQPDAAVTKTKYDYNNVIAHKATDTSSHYKLCNNQTKKHTTRLLIPLPLDVLKSPPQRNIRCLWLVSDHWLSIYLRGMFLNEYILSNAAR